MRQNEGNILSNAACRSRCQAVSLITICHQACRPSMEWRATEGRFRQVSTNLGGLWAIGETGDIFYRIGTFENSQSIGSGWWQVEGRV